MNVNFKITTDIEIPQNLYSEAAELFLNHLKKFYEAQLLKGDSLPLSSAKLFESENTTLVYPRNLNYLGMACAVYYKKDKATRNA